MEPQEVLYVGNLAGEGNFLILRVVENVGRGDRKVCGIRREGVLMHRHAHASIGSDGVHRTRPPNHCALDRGDVGIPLGAGVVGVFGVKIGHREARGCRRGCGGVGSRGCRRGCRGVGSRGRGSAGAGTGWRDWSVRWTDIIRAGSGRYGRLCCLSSADSGIILDLIARNRKHPDTAHDGSQQDATRDVEHEALRARKTGFRSYLRHSCGYDWCLDQRSTTAPTVERTGSILPPTLTTIHLRHSPLLHVRL